MWVDFEHETGPDVYSSAREQASHLFGLPRPSGIGVKIPMQLAGDVESNDQRGVRAAECCDRRGAVCTTRTAAVNLATA